MTENIKNDPSVVTFLCRLCAQVNHNGTYIFSEGVEQNLSTLISKYLPLKVCLEINLEKKVFNSICRLKIMENIQIKYVQGVKSNWRQQNYFLILLSRDRIS